MMGLFDFLFPKPTIDRFADLFMSEMRRAGVTSEIVYEKDNCRIVRGSGDETNAINLGNFFRESLALPRRNRKTHLSHVVRTILTPIDPQDAEAFFGRGMIYVRATQYDDAIADFDTAIRIDPHDAWAYYWRSRARATKAGLTLEPAPGASGRGWIETVRSNAHKMRERMKFRDTDGMAYSIGCVARAPILIPMKPDDTSSNVDGTALSEETLDLVIADLDRAVVESGGWLGGD
jgi:tetratricopeptide (TPR) repeat protein